MTPFGLHAPQGQYTAAADLGAQFCRLVMTNFGSSQDQAFLDKQVRLSQQYGIQLIVTIPLTGLPANQGRFITHLQALVERYDGTGSGNMPGLTQPIRHWQIGNEPGRQWKQDEPVEYINFFNKASTAIDAADPLAVVIGGALTGSFEEFTHPQNQKRYTDFLRGCEDHMDILDVHCYSDDPEELAKRADWIRSQTRELGFSKPIWSLEAAGPFTNRAFSPEAAAVDLVKRYVTALANGVEMVCWGALVLELGQGWGSEFTRLALLQGGIPTPAYRAYQTMTKKLGGISDVSQIDMPGSEVELYLVSRQNLKPVYVAWSKDGSPDSIVRQVPNAVAAVVTRIDGSFVRFPVVERKLNLTIGDPVFVELM